MSEDLQIPAAEKAPTVAGRTQQGIVAGLIFAAAAAILIISMSVEDPAPYLFPRMISAFMLALAITAIIRALAGLNRTGTGIVPKQFRNILPGLIVMLLYVFVLAEGLGFYAAAFLSMLVLYSLYDPNPHNEPKTWAVRFAVTIGFVALIYVVFAVALKVQTPEGILF